jgi:PKD repeat protein
MRGFLPLLVSLCVLILLAQAVSGASISITQMPALYVSDYGEGVAHPINSYTLLPDQDVSQGVWMLLGTNDQATFARIDARKDKTFLAGGAEQFNVANTGSFRWYYLYLQDGFPVGSNVEFHLHELTPAPTPTASDAKDIDIVIERAPLVIILDFAGRAPTVEHYNFTSSETLAAGQSWQLRGTNDPDILGTDNPGLFTLLDDQAGVGFTSGVPKKFTVTSPGSYQYYVFYLQDGFPVKGMNLEIELFEAGPAPTPTPTPTQTPTPTPSPTVTPTPTPTPTLLVDFEGSPRAGYVPLSVTFTDKSSGSFTSRSWDFGDGTTSSADNPVHTYTSAGVFTVNLTACNVGSCSWFTRTSYVAVIPPDTPDPTETPRYYIRIGGGSGGSSGTSSGSSAGSGAAGAGTGGATGETSGGGDQGDQGSPPDDSIGTGGSTGTGSSGSGGGSGSQGTGGSAGQGNPAGPGEPQPVTRGLIERLLEVLGDITTGAEDLIGYLQDQLSRLLGG